MDLQKDRHLFYIAKENLKAPLLSNWKPCKDPEGNIWYHDSKTNKMQKDHPIDEHYRNIYQTILKSEREQNKDSDNEEY